LEAEALQYMEAIGGLEKLKVKLNIKFVKTVPQGFMLGHPPTDSDFWSTIGVQLLPVIAG
jgi:hypothetical protein